MSGSNGQQFPNPPPQNPSPPPLPPATTRAHHGGGGTTGSSKSVTFEEVSRHFTLPIAEAASNLGVCTSVLKRICRTNGVARWPYRQFLAGKTMEDIQKEAARERKSRQLSELTKVAKPAANSAAVHATPDLQSQMRSMTHTLSSEKSKLQGSGSVSHQQTQKPQSGMLPQAVQYRSIPNFLDEFKYGFPSNGLSSLSNKWWGSDSLEGERDSSGNSEENKLPTKESSCNAEGSEITPEPVSRLVSLKSRRVKDGRDLIQLGVKRRHSPYSLSARERLVLLQVFKTLPGQWK